MIPGPPPKPADRRARGSSGVHPQTILRFEQAAQPKLPTKQPGGQPWPEATKRWWRMWADAAQAEHFGSTDWAFLLDTAVVHARFWSGEISVTAAELRQRVAKFGATPEDRMRLRMQFAQADEADAKRPEHTAGSARERRGILHALNPEGETG